jgi:RimJ/RimL family protein N-acetyltransferase
VTSARESSTAGPLDEPWLSSIAPIVQLIRLDAGTIDALAARDVDAANERAPIHLTDDFIAEANASVWEIRSRQLRSRPGDGDWITRVIYDPNRAVAVGRAGYHGPPDAVGMVEVGYSVDPVYRRQGYARAALSALLDRARVEDSVRVVRASIRPDNTASRALVAQFGFVEVGEQWDDEDGLETIFELSTP